jgi:hypothetical protein
MATRTSLLVPLLALLVLGVHAPQARAVAPGSGVRGSVSISWGNIAGGPITSWTGSAQLAFDPSPAARQGALAAIADPALGEAYRTVFTPQVHAARVTSLVSDRTETVLCTNEDLSTYEAAFNSSAASVADARVAFEILPPRVDLLTGRGTVALDLLAQAHPSGWYLQSRYVLPGRYVAAGASPCPGSGTGVPADRLPRIFAPFGSGAIPRTITDWMHDGSRALDWPLRRTPQGWRVMIGVAERQTFSDTPFGPQDSQTLDVRIASDLYLAGSWTALEARCRIPEGRIARARSASDAVRWARRAGFTRARFAGIKRIRGMRGTRYVLTGPSIGMGEGRCGPGTYRVWRYTA